MEKNVSSVAEQDKTAEVKKNPKLIELARPYKFDDKEYTEIDLSGLDDLTIKKLTWKNPTMQEKFAEARAAVIPEKGQAESGQNAD